MIITYFVLVIYNISINSFHCVNSVETGNTLLCGGAFLPATSIIIRIVQREHFFKIVLLFHDSCVRIMNLKIKYTSSKN